MFLSALRESFVRAIDRAAVGEVNLHRYNWSQVPFLFRILP